MDIFRVYLPKMKFPHAGQVADHAAGFEFDQFRVGGRVPACPGGLADFARPQLEARLQPVEQAGFADSRRPHKERDPASQEAQELFLPPVRNDAGEHKRVSYLFVYRSRRFECGGAGQVQFVETDCGGYLTPFRNSQHTVQHIPVRRRFGHREDRHELIDVRGQDLFFP